MSSNEMLVGNEMSEEEKGWMSALEEAAKAEGVSWDSRFFLASVAIVTKGDVKKGLLRLRNWKKVCEQYDFKNVGEKHGTQWIKDHANSLVFSVGQDKNGCNGYGVNLGSFLPSVLKTDYEMQCYLRAVADNMRHNTPTLAHVRRGSFFFVELKGYGWRNFSMTLDKKVTSVYQDAYPIKVKKILIVNPPALSLFVAIKEICKVFVKKKTIDRVAPVRRASPPCSLTPLPPRPRLRTPSQPAPAPPHAAPGLNDDTSAASSPEGLSQYFEHDQIPAYL
eukprot:CAMPEP_0171998704 /NCGR_PEP_ID=MMETSP1041-20130122/1383_1 /TAXON_ID=464988 /ORGANISM="Hemiselmis andersenii, Strain CCMP439" /LENGTH=277 /DNA_ID=CAMNT_0012652105 /DNA_START=96 /DNA_END=925 /DNA_ORIENTATION=-